MKVNNPNYLNGLSSSASEIDEAILRVVKGKIKFSSSYITLQEAFDDLNSYDTLVINKNYEESVLKLNKSNITIKANYFTISSNIVDNSVLTINGYKNIVTGLIVDGTNTAKTGVLLHCNNSTITNNIVKNIKATGASSNGILESTSAYRNKICRNNIFDISAVTTGNDGEDIGASTGILSLCTSSRVDYTVIDSNTIDNISGREGVGIYVNAPSYSYLTKYNINNNIINNVNRRAIKVNGSSNMIKNNTYTNSLPLSSLLNLRTAIEVWGQNTVSGNDLDATYCSGIIVNDNSMRSIIANNIIICTDNSAPPWTQQAPRGIFILSSDVTCNNNNVTGGYSCIETSGARTIIRDNILTAHATAYTGIRVESGAIDTMINNTTLLSKEQDKYFSIGIRVNASGVKIDKVVPNYYLSTSPNINTVRFYSGADTANINEIDGVGINLTVRDATTKTKASNITHSGNSTNGVGAKIYYGTDNPANLLSTMQYQKGDVVLNSSPIVGSVSSWHCISGGSPGSWASTPVLV